MLKSITTFSIILLLASVKLVSAQEALASLTPDYCIAKDAQFVVPLSVNHSNDISQSANPSDILTIVNNILDVISNNQSNSEIIFGNNPTEMMMVDVSGSEEMLFQVNDLEGSMIINNKSKFPSGSNIIKLNKLQFNSSGVYEYSLTVKQKNQNA